MAYKTGWLKKVINGVSTKIFSFAHVKTVYTDYENGKLLSDKLTEIDDDIAEIKCNVKLLGFELGDNYSTDFVCSKKNGELLIVETVLKKHLLKPMNCRLLDGSRRYWMGRGATDFRLAVGDKNDEK